MREAGAPPGSQGLIKSKVITLIKLCAFLLVWNPGDTFERDGNHKDLYPDRDDTRCLNIRPYRKCELIEKQLTDEYFDQPIGTLVKWGCFPNDDMNSVCSDFGICERTKRYAVKRGGTE